MSDKYIAELPVDVALADTDAFPVDSVAAGTRFILASDIRTYMQAGVAVDLSGYETTAVHAADLTANAAADRARANHTGTQLAATVSDFAATADARVAAASVNALADVTVASPQVGDTLEWNGSAWVNAVPAGGVPEARVLAINDTKVDVTSGTSTVAFLSYTVDRAPSDWIAPGLMYRAVLTGRCANTSGAGRTLDIAMTFDGTAIITVRLPIAVTTSPNLIPWTSEFVVSCPGEDLLWINGTAYLGAPFNGTTGLVDTAGVPYAGSKQTGSVSTAGVTSLALAMTYKRDSTLSTFTTTFANSFIHQIQVQV